MHEYRLCQPKNFLFLRGNLPTLEALTVEFVWVFFLLDKKKQKLQDFPQLTTFYMKNE